MPKIPKNGKKYKSAADYDKDQALIQKAAMKEYEKNLQKSQAIAQKNMSLLKQYKPEADRLLAYYQKNFAKYFDNAAEGRVNNAKSASKKKSKYMQAGKAGKIKYSTQKAAPVATESSDDTPSQ